MQRQHPGIGDPDPQHAFEQAQVVLLREVMVPVAGTEFGVFLLRHIGGRMRQCLHQAHADHIGRGLVGGHRATDVDHRALDAAGDDGGGIEQSAVPVEGDQVEPARALRLHVRKTS